MVWRLFIEGFFSTAREFLPQGHDILTFVDPPLLPTVHVLSRYNPSGMNDPIERENLKLYLTYLFGRKMDSFRFIRTCVTFCNQDVVTI